MWMVIMKTLVILVDLLQFPVLTEITGVPRIAPHPRFALWIILAHLLTDTPFARPTISMTQIPALKYVYDRYLGSPHWFSNPPGPHQDFKVHPDMSRPEIQLFRFVPAPTKLKVVGPVAFDDQCIWQAQKTAITRYRETV